MSDHCLFEIVNIVLMFLVVSAGGGAREEV